MEDEVAELDLRYRELSEVCQTVSLGDPGRQPSPWIGRMRRSCRMRMCPNGVVLRHDSLLTAAAYGQLSQQEGAAHFWVVHCLCEGKGKKGRKVKSKKQVVSFQTVRSR